MTKERADLGFGDELDNFDPTAWTPKPGAAVKDRSKADSARKAAEATGFPSREPTRPRTVARQRRRRTGRNAQINIKATPETIEAFYAVADGQGWGVGETLEHALALLQERYPPRGA